MGRLAEEAFAPTSLRRAWLDVLANDRQDGQLAPSVTRFEAGADEALGRLTAELAWGAYEPGDLTEIVMDGTRRVLHIPRVVDRIVERAILEVVTPLVDPLLGSASFAYRPGLGVADAVQAVAQLRDEGLTWVLRTDVDDCFPSIPVRLARDRLSAVVDDPDLMRVVDLLLGRCGVSPGRGRRVFRGLAQGCALSPLLSNLVLVDVDSALLEAGFSIVRYADDMVIATDSQDEAWEAARCATRALEELTMQLGADKTEVMSFSEGFVFLGEEFGPRYPPVLVDHRVEDPERKVLYAACQGGRIRIARGRLIVEDAKDTEILDVPTGLVGRIVCFGSVGFSAGARSWALANDVDVVFASRRGTYLGSFVGSGNAPRSSRLRAQLRSRAPRRHSGSRVPSSRRRFASRWSCCAISPAVNTPNSSRTHWLGWSRLSSCSRMLARARRRWGWKAPRRRHTSRLSVRCCPKISSSPPAAASHPWTWPIRRCRFFTRSCWASA